MDWFRNKEGVEIFHALFVFSGVLTPCLGAAYRKTTLFAWRLELLVEKLFE